MSYSYQGETSCYGRQDTFTALYHHMIKKIGSLNALTFLMELNFLHNFIQSPKGPGLIYDERHGPYWFWVTIEQIEEKFCLTKDEQRTCIKILTDLGLIEMKVFGVPGKRHFRLNIDKVNEFFSEDFSNNLSRKRETRKVESGKPAKYISENPKSAHILEKQTALEYINEKDNINKEDVESNEAKKGIFRIDKEGTVKPLLGPVDDVVLFSYLDDFSEDIRKETVKRYQERMKTKQPCITSIQGYVRGIAQNLKREALIAQKEKKDENSFAPNLSLKPEKIDHKSLITNFLSNFIIDKDHYDFYNGYVEIRNDKGEERTVSFYGWDKTRDRLIFALTELKIKGKNA